MTPPRESSELPESLFESDSNTTKPETRLAILINQGIRRKGITIRKLSEASGIALKYLEHMSGGNIEKFPPAPYLRNYLILLGRILDFDGQAVWEQIRVDELAVRSGKHDRLPRVRQALPSRKNLVWIIGVAALLAVYLLFRLPDIVGQPSLSIGFPTETITTVSVSPVTVIGTVKNGDEFFINDERIPLGQDGLWQKNIDLQEGMNTIELKAKKFLGQEVRVLRQIIYTPTASSVKNVSSTNTETTSTVSSTESTSSTKATSTKKKE